MNRVYNGVLIASIILLGHVEKVHSQDFYLTKDGYAYFENNPKTLGVDFGIGIPEEWTIQDSELPGVIAEMYYNQDVKLIISIEAGETFISRKQARAAIDSGEIERKITEEQEIQGFGTTLIDATSEIVDSYPARKLTFSMLRDDFIGDSVVKNPYIGELWFIFYEDVQICIMTFCPKHQYEKNSIFFRNLVKSFFFLN